MPPRRWPRRAAVQPGTQKRAKRTLALLVAAMILAALAALSAGLRSMVTEYAASAARDMVVTRVNQIVKDVMVDPAFRGEELVKLERDASGAVTAVTANVTAINTLSSEVLGRAVDATEQEELTVKIPLANLLGSALFMNRGPSVSVNVTVLSSSTAGFRSEITSAGINQTLHQLFLDLDVQLSFLLPWREMDTGVQSEILVSETVIVGQVPDSYLNWER